MSQTNGLAQIDIPNPNDRMQNCCFHRIFYPSKIKEKLGEAFPSCFPKYSDSIEPQDELNKLLAPFGEYCGLELNTQKEKLQEIKEQLGKVLSDDKANYESMYKEDPRQFRKKWRDKRIKIYNYLLCLALYDPNQSEDLWIKEQKSTIHFYREAPSKLKPDGFYTYLVDQVHEDEEIMFKFYCAPKGVEKPWRKDAPWLIGSICVYSKFLIDEALKTLRLWEDGNQQRCDEVIKTTKKKFVDKLSSLHGRCFKKERNWRNRARFYYLLGRERYKGISNGHVGDFKNFDDEGPFCRLVREMIVEDEDLFHQESKVQDLPLVCKKKYIKQKERSFVGHWKVNRLLAWASATNDVGFVKILLKYYLDGVKSRANFDFEWEKSMGESWAMALWNASYMGYKQIVMELLSWEIPYYLYYSEYFFDQVIKPPHESPLHIAVLKMDVSMVEAFCTIASQHLNCNDRNHLGLTTLEIATKLKVTNNKEGFFKRKIQHLLLQRQEVKDAATGANYQRQLVVDSTNAVMVGGALIASITFAGWLSPPLGYNSYYQLVEPTTIAAPPDSYESYMSVQGHLTIQLFAIFNSLSFYFAIATIVAGIDAFGAIKVMEDTYLVKTVIKLRRNLTWATNLFLASVVCVLVAFSCAGIAVLPPIKKYQMNMYITMAIGGFICTIFICKMVWYALYKKIRNRVKLELHSVF